MVFDKNWFLKYQQSLLWFANTWIGRKILYIDGYGSSVRKNRIVHIEPNAIWWRSGKKIVAEFRTQDKFARRLYYSFKPFWYLIHFWDMTFTRNIVPQFNLGFDTLTQYPGSIGADNPADGQVIRSSVNETFATIRAGAGITNNTNGGVKLDSSGTTDQYINLLRYIHCYDTSSLTDNATISAAVISLNGSAKTLALGSPAVHIAASTPASTTALAASDYGQCQTTSFGNKAYADFTTANDYNDITLNASGIANISKTGVSKFSAQLSWDILNDTTGLTWAGNDNSSLSWYSAAQAGTSNDPKLVVTYTVSASGNNRGYSFII